MKIKLFLYAISILCSTFAISGINFNGFIKKGHIWEARFLSVMLIFALSYLVTNFFVDIIDLVK